MDFFTRYSKLWVFIKHVKFILENLVEFSTTWYQTKLCLGLKLGTLGYSLPKIGNVFQKSAILRFGPLLTPKLGK